MLTPAQLRVLVERQGTLIIDGGLATELENRGFDLNHALWSAKILEEDPMAIKQAHLDYYIAGADIAITASYQASTQGFAAHLNLDEKKSITLMKRSAILARSALEESYGQGVKRDRQLIVAGSVGPYGAYLADGSEYTGNYQLSRSQFKDFHRPRIAALVEADVDLLAIETMPQFEEIEAVLELLSEEFDGTTAWLSCTLEDVAHISDGTPLEDVVRVAHEFQDIVMAFGINCIPLEIATESLQRIRQMTALPLVCYPNSGATWNAQNKQWSDSKSGESELGPKAKEWKEAGARLIGGCCKTVPRDITAVSKALEQRK